LVETFSPIYKASRTVSHFGPADPAVVVQQSSGHGSPEHDAMKGKKVALWSWALQR